MKNTTKNENHFVHCNRTDPREPRPELLREIDRMLRWATAPVFHLQDRQLFGDRRHLRYLGQKEGGRIFRATFPEVAVNTDSMFVQIIAYVDETTKLLRFLEAEYRSKDLRYSTRFRAEYTPCRLSAGWRTGTVCLIPVSIDYRMSCAASRVEGKLRNGQFLSPICTRKGCEGRPLYAPL